MPRKKKDCKGKGKKEETEVPAEKLMDGIKAIRMGPARMSNADAAVKSLVASKNSDVKAVLSLWDGEPADLIAKVKTIHGPTDKGVIDTLFPHGRTLPRAAKKVSKTAKKEPKGLVHEKQVKSGKKAKDGEPCCDEEADATPVVGKGLEVKLVKPTQISCPDTDGEGNETVLVMQKDGLFGCGVIKPK